ncbi:hypothetical protein [Aquimarina sp. I32.4]|uniref:XAC2610-related protein n=1 Tax=Aquimarina sp. I32.4 TaxID=2053903 RepID=UPI000CDEF948|nr:hypothetical protein [Aquimarina sp. I32.4]
MKYNFLLLSIFLLYSCIQHKSKQESLSTNIHTKTKEESLQNGIVHTDSIFKKYEYKTITIRDVTPKLYHQHKIVLNLYKKGSHHLYQKITHSFYSMTSYKPKVFDFNFDGLEDFALEEDNTINTGLVHGFYMQKKNGLFIRSDFPFSFIPSKIDYDKQTLTVYNILGCCKIHRAVYQLKDKKWEQIESVVEEMETSSD